MEDKIAVITGGNSGIGRAVALGLHRHFTRLILVGRDEQKGEATVAELNRLGTAQVQFIKADFSRMDEVRRVGQHIEKITPHINALIQSAGVLRMQRVLTSDGIESNFAINYLSKFILTRTLLKHLKDGAPGRVVLIGGSGTSQILDLEQVLGERKATRTAIGTATFAVDLLVAELTRRMADADVKFYGVNPGIVRTDILRDMPSPVRIVGGALKWFVGISAEQSAQTPIQLVLGPVPSGDQAMFFRAGKQSMPITVPPLTFDPDLALNLWNFSERLEARVMAAAT